MKRILLSTDIPSVIKYRKDDSLMKVLKFIIDMQVKNNKIDVSIDFNPSRI